MKGVEKHVEVGVHSYGHILLWFKLYTSKPYAELRLTRGAMWCQDQAMRHYTYIVLVCALLAMPAEAQVASIVQSTTVAQVPPGTDSEKAHILALLLKGDIEGAISYWGVAHVGQQTPAWLLALRTSYEASRQVAGKCQDVARSIHTAITHLGGKAQFVELTTLDRREAAYILFRMNDGRMRNVSQNGYHVVVRINDWAYDAYTGPTGLPWRQYISRLEAQTKLIEKAVEVISE